MKRSSGVRLCATAVVGALSFALVAGCGNGDARHSEPAAKALSGAELKKLIIAEGDVSGYKVEPVPATRAKPITTDGARCRPLARVMSGLPPLDAAAKADRMAMENQKKSPSAGPTSLDDLDEGKFKETMKKSLDRDVTTVTLASYDGDGAERALTAVSTAVKACASGFPAQQSGTKMRFTEVTGEKALGTGDGAVAFSAMTDTNGADAAPVHTEVVRTGSTLSVYFTTNLGAMLDKKAYTVSPEVVKAQQTKLK
ncbi:hypothetical protein [Streptomyces yokosukanensis]|uniref:hypothetical protein n=1 Tax=Streptomyces yokosukanensis TaxID=67386 RepID=UPI000A78B8AC|nr:hypothetical protein [Streptomyces yokosukanensis]